MRLRRMSIVLFSLSVIIAVPVATSNPASAQVPIPSSIDVQRNVQYGTASGQSLLMDVYSPKGGGPYPGLIAIHGGGFVGGDKEMQEAVSVFFAMNGYVTFAINYRLGPTYPYPAAVDDAATSVRYIRDHARQYNVDPNKIGVMGSSAGATIAASLAARSKPPYTTGSDVAAAVCWSAALDLNRVLAERLNNRMVLEGVPGYIGLTNSDAQDPTDQAKLRDASPINQVQRENPPFYVANSTNEFIPIDQTKDFVAKLQSLDIPVTTQYIPGDRHALHYMGTAKDPSLQFLNQYVLDFNGRPATGSPTPFPTGKRTGKHSKKHQQGPQALVQPESHSSLAIPILIGVGALVVGVVLGSILARRRNRARARPGW